MIIEIINKTVHIATRDRLIAIQHFPSTDNDF